MSSADGEAVRSLAREAREARHAAVLDEAALEFNRAGVAGASLSVIARRVGLSRASLYNYCADRQDLVHQCYLRACELTGRDLRRAAAGTGKGLDKVTALLRLSLDMDHAPMAVLSELEFLPPARQAEVRAARSLNADLLADFIREGIEDGSIRPCDVNLAGQSIWGMLAWAPLSNIWTENNDETFAIRMAAAIPTVIAQGIAAEGAALPARPRRLADILTPVSGSERDERLEALAKAGSRLFNQRGIDGVSLDDVAAEVGATKGHVYHYFDSKPAFVAFCYERAFRIYDRIMEVSEGGETGLECSFTAMSLNTEAQLQDAHPLSLTTGFDTLGAGMRKTFAAHTAALSRRSVELGRRGVKDGSLRPFDLEPVALASAGTFNYLAKWMSGSNTHKAGEVADEVSSIFLMGLGRRAA